MPPPTHLNALQALELAARTGSFVAAAEELGITPAAVGQRVKILEDYLGISLLRRGRAGIEPSPELMEALPFLRQGFADIEQASLRLNLQQGCDIHIAAEPDFVELWLQPRLAAFRAMQPNVRFCINGEGDAPLRLARADCEIVFGPHQADDMTDLLFHDYVVPLCSAENLTRTGGIERDERLEGFPLIHVDFYKDDPAGLTWPGWVDRHRLSRTDPGRGMRFKRVARSIDSVLAHSGVALSGIALIQHLVREAKVGLPYPIAMGQPTGFAFIARYRETGMRKPIERFRAWLRDEAGQTAAWISTISH